MKRFLIMLLCASSASTFGQQAVTSVGGDVVGFQGSVSYSIGQIATTFIENGGALNQGVQQPYEIFSVLSLENNANDLSLSVHPNPTSGIIEIHSVSNGSLSVEISDEAGRIVYTQKYDLLQKEIVDLTAFARGTYSVRVFNSQSNQIIRIIKN